MLRIIWAWMNSLGAPAAPAGSQATPLVPAGEAREPVNDADAMRTRIAVDLQRERMDALCQAANAYVYRDYGQGPVTVYEGVAADPTTAQHAAEHLGIATYEGTAPETPDDHR